ncbi:hypothetical protein E05_33470 [Plautia stali symbiont]|nr:hypothetical protein E05_33470 [Plautia stali symbiont]
MRITERIAVRLHQLRSLFSNKEKIMSDQTVINPTSAAAQQALSPLESFANEMAGTAAVPAAADSAADSLAQPATQPAAATQAAQPAAAVPASTEQLFHADAPVDLDQQLATQDTLANGSASAGSSAAATLGVRNAQTAAPVVVTAASDAVAQDISAGVKDFVQAFSFVEQGVIKLGSAAKDELIALAKKYL